MVCLCREIIKWGLIIYLITYSFVWWACPDTLFNFMLKIYENSSNLSVILTIILVYLIFMNSSLIRWYQRNWTSVDCTTVAKCFIVLLLAWQKALNWLISIAWWITCINHVPSIPGALGVMNRSCLMVVVMPTEGSFTVRCRHWASRQFFFLKVGSHCTSMPDPPSSTLAASCISYRPWYLVIEFWCVVFDSP